MKTVFNLGPALSTALAAALFAAAGCGSLDRSVARNHCATSSECNPGHVCVAGICQAPTDAAADRHVDALTPDVMPDADAKSDATADLPATGEAGADAPISPPPGDGGVDSPVQQPSADADDAPDAPAATGVDAGTDVTDAPADVIVAPDAQRDAGVIQPGDPCVTGPRQEAPAATPGLLAALPGLWRLCATNPAADPDVSWLVGSTPFVQLDARHWWRCADGQPPSCDVMAQGLYFRVLEGSKSVFHFADQVDPFDGGGADISIRYFAGSKLLQLAACDGAIRCSSNVTYLVSVGPAPGS